MHGNTSHRGRGERGSALYLSVVVLVVLASISTAMIMVSTRTKEEYGAAQEDLRRKCLAEAGLSRVAVDLHRGGTGNLGSETAPVSFGSGSFWVTTTAQPGDLFISTSHGTVGSGTRALRAVLRKRKGVFHHAMFIGNSSKDPNYTFKLGGKGTSGDVVNGDLFCAGNVSIEYDAVVNGQIRASGTIAGATGTTGYVQEPPNLADMNYSVTADVKVANEFASYATYKAMTNAGSAYQVPQDKASHIFRLNPSDRKTNTQSTVKNDYFLEDPYEAWVTKSTLNFASATKVTLTGVAGKPGTSGNGLVYYVDGNLWLHSGNTYSFGIDHNLANGVQVTIVARGNIYFSDNFFLKNTNKDGVAFVAIKDPVVADSGNIYFGDPTYGTIAIMEGFMYAENNFCDLNLDSSGSKTVTVKGIMSAGNQVKIARDTSLHWGKTSHTKLTVTLDDRVVQGTIALPGLPFLEKGEQSDLGVSIVSVRPVATDD